MKKPKENIEFQYFRRNDLFNHYFDMFHLEPNFRKNGPLVTQVKEQTRPRRQFIEYLQSFMKIYNIFVEWVETKKKH